jgi:hypothetical protein
MWPPVEAPGRVISSAIALLTFRGQQQIAEERLAIFETPGVAVHVLRSIGSNGLIVLKNYLLQLQISKKWEAVLRQGNCAPGCRRNSNNLEFCSAKFGFSAL